MIFFFIWETPHFFSNKIDFGSLEGLFDYSGVLKVDSGQNYWCLLWIETFDRDFSYQYDDQSGISQMNTTFYWCLSKVSYVL